MNTHMEEREAISGAVPGFVVLANVWDRRTDGRVAGASGGIKELGEDDVARQVRQAHGRKRRKDPSCHVCKRQAGIEGKVSYNLSRAIEIGLRHVYVREKTERCKQ